MAIILHKSEENLWFLSLVNNLLGIERAEVELWFVTTGAGLTGVALARRRRDRDGVPYLVAGYRQDLSGHDSESNDCDHLPDSEVRAGVPDLLKKKWTSIEIDTEIGRDGGADLPPEVQEIVDLDTTTVTAVERSRFLLALSTAAELPPLDATESGNLHLHLEGSVLTVSRSAGENRLSQTIPLIERAEVGSVSELIHEVTPAVVRDLTVDSRMQLALAVSRTGMLFVDASEGVIALPGTPGGPIVTVEETAASSTFLSLSESEIDLLHDMIIATDRSTSGGPMSVEVRTHSVFLTSPGDGLLEGVEIELPVSKVVGEPRAAQSFRPDSLVWLLRTAKRCGGTRYPFYLGSDGKMSFTGRATGSAVAIRTVDALSYGDESPIILWASGGSAELLVQSPHRHILLSYAALPQWARLENGGFEDYLDRLGLLTDGIKVFLDSGAYSVWRAGKEVDFDEYIDFLDRNAWLLDTYVALDVIRGTVRENRDRYERMLDAGLAPLYVWHLYEDWTLLDEILETYRDEIALGGIGAGGAPHTPYPIREPYVAELVARVSQRVEAKIHLFGTTAEWLLKRYPIVYSADSTSWTQLGQNRKIQTPFGTFSVRRSDRDSLWGHRLQEEVEKFIEHLEFSGREVSFETIASDLNTRHIYNLGYLSFFEEHHYCIDWMKLEQRFIPSEELKSRGKLVLTNSTVLLPSGITGRSPGA